VSDAVRFIKKLANVGGMLALRREWKVQERRQTLVRSALDAGEPPPLKPEHLALIRLLRVTWSPVESGAAGVRCYAPFGTGTRTVAVGMSAMQTGDEALFVRTMIEVARLLPSYVAEQAARMAGLYPIPSDMATYLSGGDAGVRADGMFEFRAEHAKLLSNASWRIEHEAYWRGLQGGNPDWPMPSIDGKRPYGDCSYYQLDLAEILGCPYAFGSDREAVPDPEKYEALQKLHHESLAALQVVLAADHALMR
jgi:hypothetical protein